MKRFFLSLLVLVVCIRQANAQTWSENVVSGNCPEVHAVDWFGSKLIVATDDGVRIFENESSGAPFQTLLEGKMIKDAKVSPNGDILAATDYRKQLCLFKIENDLVKEIKSFPFYHYPAKITFSPDGRFLTLLLHPSDDKKQEELHLLHVFEAKEAGRHLSLVGHTGFQTKFRAVQPLQFSADGKYLSSIDAETFRAWDIENRFNGMIQSPGQFRNGVDAQWMATNAFVGNDRSFVVRYQDPGRGVVTDFFSAKSAQPSPFQSGNRRQKTWEGFLFNESTHDLSPDGTWVGLSLEKKTIYYGQAGSPVVTPLVTGVTRTRKISVSPHGNLVAICVAQGPFTVWELKPGEKPQKLLEKAEAAEYTRFGPNGGRLAVYSGSNLKVLNVPVELNTAAK